MQIRKKLLTALLFCCWLVVVFMKIRTTSNTVYIIIWLITGLIAAFLQGIVRIKYNNIQKIWMSFVFFTFFSTLVNGLIGTKNNYDSMNLITDSLFQIIFPMIVIFLFSNIGIQKKFYLKFRNFMLFCSILGIFEYITKIQWYSGWIKTENALHNFQYYSNVAKNTYRLCLVFYHPIYYSLLLVISIICVIYVPFKNKYMQIASIGIMGINLILTQSRTGWLALFVCIILYEIKKRNIKVTRERVFSIIRIIFIIATACVITLIINPRLWTQLFTIIQERILHAIMGNATDVRTANVLMAWNILSQTFNPLLWIIGGGNMYAISYLHNNPTFGYWANAIDNQYITTLLNYGIIGVILMAIFLVKVIKLFARKYDNKINEVPYLVLTALMVSAIFYDPYGANIIYYLMLIFLGMTSSES